MTIEHTSIASEGLVPKVISKVKKTLAIATLGLLSTQLVIPPEIKQPLFDSGGNFTYIVDGDVIPQPYDMFRKKSIVVIEINGIEYRAVVDHKLDINSTQVRVISIDVENPIAEISMFDTNSKEIKSIVEVQLLEVKNDYTNKVEVEFI
ncbi:hypothetical protein GD1_108 [Paraglaciecola Antarctic GD virus 1]|nr:hypothetical protein GD1_108 [Paraglaciecola Antarctic GD virus 1]